VTRAVQRQGVLRYTTRAGEQRPSAPLPKPHWENAPKEGDPMDVLTAHAIEVIIQR